MGLTKQEIRDRLITVNKWIDNTWADNDLGDVIINDRFRYVIAIWICGNRQAEEDITFAKLAKDGDVPDDLSTLFSPIPVAPADFRQIPEGAYDLEYSLFALEGGTALYAKTSGNSLDVTVNYWDGEF